jgi:hypothetical protein
MSNSWDKIGRKPKSNSIIWSDRVKRAQAVQVAEINTCASQTVKNWCGFPFMPHDFLSIFISSCPEIYGKDNTIDRLYNAVEIQYNPRRHLKFALFSSGHCHEQIFPLPF